MGSKDLGARLSEAAERAGYGGKGGPSRLHRLITTRYGVQVSLQGLSYWLHGDRNPELPSLVGLLDALNVFGAERREIIELAHPSVRRIDAPNRSDDTDSDRTLEDPPTPPSAS